MVNIDVHIIQSFFVFSTFRLTETKQLNANEIFPPKRCSCMQRVEHVNKWPYDFNEKLHDSGRAAAKKNVRIATPTTVVVVAAAVALTITAMQPPC